MARGGGDLAGWTLPEIESECSASYRPYKREKDQRYSRYFAAHPELAGKGTLRARDLPAALPPGHADLAQLIAQRDLHREHLSGNSSQILAMALLGSATAADRTLSWLFEALRPTLPPPRVGSMPRTKLEKTLTPDLLGEVPKQTAIDFYVWADNLVLCVEAKWTEDGLNPCSCRNPLVADCSSRILERPLYWEAAQKFFGLPERRSGSPCPLHPGYQAIRNAAAAEALANGREAAFGLIYDAENPYFGGAGYWPGWPTVLRETIADQAGGAIRFASCSWQELIVSLPIDNDVRSWAHEKHGLGE